MAAAAGYLAIALLLLSVAPLSAAKPNILFMMADQLRADLIAAAGNNITKTPNVDRLAREGVVR